MNGMIKHRGRVTNRSVPCGLFVITLNGQRLEDCCAADPKRGAVTVYCRRPDGSYVIKDGVVTETIFGSVEVWKDPRATASYLLWWRIRTIVWRLGCGSHPCLRSREAA